MATKRVDDRRLILDVRDVGNIIYYIRGSKFNTWETISPPPVFRGSYGFNINIFDNFGQSTRDDTGATIYNIKNAGRVPILLDSDSPIGGFCHTRLDDPSLHEYCFCINRHNVGVNSLFLDWSVRKVGLKELWTLKWYKDFNTANRWTLAGGVKPTDWPEWMRGFKDY
jgi:prepilin-type processing-associated H-X9-DG protein